MAGMDFLESITPACEKTESRYILIVVNYFSSHVWLKASPDADQETVMNFWRDTTFGYPEYVYSDNGSHFTDLDITALFCKRYHAPITHPQSVGLAERVVQLVISQLILEDGSCRMKYSQRDFGRGPSPRSFLTLTPV